MQENACLGSFMVSVLMSLSYDFTFQGNCNFETDTCGYKDTSTGLYEWGRASPANNPRVDPNGLGRGPQTDNTKKTNQGMNNSNFSSC